MMAPASNGASAGSRGGLKEVLRSRQEARNRKSCDPCRERKVRCDERYPCATCSKRGYPDLCNYRESRPQRHATERDLVRAQPSQADEVTGEPSSALALPARVENDSTPAHLAAGANSHPKGVSLGLTSNVVDSHPLHGASLASLTREPSSHFTNAPNELSAFDTGVLPLLGVNEHPNAAQWTATSNGLLNDFLSIEQDVYALFHSYKHRVHPFHSIPLDVDQMERRLCAIIEFRHNPGTDVGLETDKVPQWLCLLHAVLASGAQFSEVSLERRFSLSREHSGCR